MDQIRDRMADTGGLSQAVDIAIGIGGFQIENIVRVKKIGFRMKAMEIQDLFLRNIRRGAEKNRSGSMEMKDLGNGPGQGPDQGDMME